MANLIYTCVTGKEIHKQMCVVLVKTIRNIAKFQGEVIILTDNQHGLEHVSGLCDVRQVCFEKISHERKSSYFTNNSFYNRIVSGDFFNPNNYDAIMYMDSDCFVRKNIDFLFSDVNDFVYFEEPCSVRTACAGYEVMRGLDVDCGDFEMINSGTFVVSGSMYSDVMSAWKKSVLENPELNAGGDQAYLNYIIRKGIVKARKNDKCIVSFGYPNYENFNSHIHHFIWVKDKLREMLQAYNFSVKNCNSVSYVKKNIDIIRNIKMPRIIV